MGGVGSPAGIRGIGRSSLFFFVLPSKFFTVLSDRTVTILTSISENKIHSVNCPQSQKCKWQCPDSNPSFIAPKVEWLYVEDWALAFLLSFREGMNNQYVSIGKSSAVKLVLSSKASGKKKLANRLVTGNWRKIVREGAPSGSMWILSLLLLK